MLSDAVTKINNGMGKLLRVRIHFFLVKTARIRVARDVFPIYALHYVNRPNLENAPTRATLVLGDA